MFFIAHRGNISGPNPEQENHPDYITSCISRGYHVEVDLWRFGNSWALGHDAPQYEISNDFFEVNGVVGFTWMHAKNIEALYEMATSNRCQKWNYFWHEEDDFTLTNNNFIWTFMNKRLTNKSICVMPEKSNYTLESIKGCAGVCSDYIKYYSGELNG
jgi:hypothetical protein